MFLRKLTFAFCLFITVPSFSAPLLIAAGGYGSCPIAGLPGEMRASAQITALAKRLGADLLKVCFAMSSSTVFASHNGGGVQRLSVDKFVAQIAKMELKDGIYFVGQSYGGWLSMKTVLALPAATVVHGLATNDPISPVNCAPPVMTASWALGPHPGCNEAPADLRPRFNEVRSRAKRWVHLYQTDYRFLHSSAIAEADRSTRFEYAPTWMPFGAHFLMETDESVWRSISNYFAQ